LFFGLGSESPLLSTGVSERYCPSHQSEIQTSSIVIVACRDPRLTLLETWDTTMLLVPSEIGQERVSFHEPTIPTDTATLKFSLS
jgi:hypothetical protein